MSTFLASLAIYLRPRLLVMLFLGFSCGLPLPLTGFTLRQWMSESEVDLAAIGMTALIGIAYAFKFAWSPFIDRMALGPLTRRFGRRRGWLLPIQVLLALAIGAMAATDPRIDPLHTAAAAVLVAFLSASQDIVVDAYRIESLTVEEQGAGLAAYIWGYRVALLAGGAGVLLLVGVATWPVAYAVMAFLVVVGIATCLFMPEPVAAPEAVAKPAGGPLAWLKTAIVGPFREFTRRDAWLAILAFIALFKLGEALAGIMTAPFYRSLGFSREEVAAISSVFGLVVTLGGVAVGGVLVHRIGVHRALIATGIMQMVSNLMYVALAHAGHDRGMLFLQVGVENFTDGLADAAFVAYLSSLTNVAFTATQYALLSSLAAVPLRTLGASSGWLARELGWPDFFVLTTLAALPALMLMIWIMRRFPTRRVAVVPDG